MTDTVLMAMTVTPRARDRVTFECVRNAAADALAISGVDALTVTCTMMLPALTSSVMSEAETPSRELANFCLKAALLEASKASTVLDTVNETLTTVGCAGGSDCLVSRWKLHLGTTCIFSNSPGQDGSYFQLGEDEPFGHVYT